LFNKFFQQIHFYPEQRLCLTEITVKQPNTILLSLVADSPETKSGRRRLSLPAEVFGTQAGKTTVVVTLRHGLNPHYRALSGSV